LLFAVTAILRPAMLSGRDSSGTPEGRAQHGAGGVADPPEPPKELVSIADAPTSIGFPDQGSEEANRPYFDDFSWRIFVALNWPAKDMGRGIPDKTKPFKDADSGPRVWETWKASYEIVPDNPWVVPPVTPYSHPPTPWDEYATVLPTAKLLQADAGRSKVLPGLTKLMDFSQANNGGAEGEGPLVDQLRRIARYELRINRVEYNFIRDNKFYLRDALRDAWIKTGKTGVVFPDQSIEVKAAWRELPDRPDVLSRFYHRKDATIIDWDKDHNLVERKATIGLVGFHIVCKMPQRENWIWSTFEHVDNAKSSDGVASPSFCSEKAGRDWLSPGTNQKPSDWQDRLRPGYPIPTDFAPTEVARNPASDSPPATQQTNRNYQDHKDARDSVWKYYRLVRTQWPNAKTGTPEPRDHVQNIAMETYFQGDVGLEYGCMECHASANYCRFVYFPQLRAYPQDALEFKKLSTLTKLAAPSKQLPSKQSP
jgi:hypothetical protein